MSPAIAALDSDQCDDILKQDTYNRTKTASSDQGKQTEERHCHINFGHRLFTLPSISFEGRLLT
jgi:hypothetical protein